MPPAAQASSSKLKAKSTDGKKKTTTKAVPDAALDIDSIFSKPAKSKTNSDAVTSGKGKEKAHDDGGKTSKLAAEESGPTGASKKKKKAKKVEGDDNTTSTTKAEPTRVVEVVDTSIPKVKEVVEPIKGKKRDKKAAEEDEMFADSRGTGPRRKTEEGFLIYKEAELDIDPEAGGTDLCPFDCECCHSDGLEHGSLTPALPLRTA